MQEILEQIVRHAQGIWRYRWYAMAVAWVVILTGWAMVARMPDLYESSARIHVDTRSILRPLLRGLTVQSNVEQRVALMHRTLLSRPNLEKLAREADLDLTADTPQEMERLLNDISGGISLSGRTQQFNLYDISYRHNDPQVAQRVVQGLLNIFVESTLGESREDVNVAQQFLDEQIEEYEKRLVAAEEELKEFKRKNIGLMPSSGQDYFARLQASQEALTTARLKLDEAVKRRDELKRQLTGEEPVFGLGTPADAKPGGDHPLDRRIQNLKVRLDELRLKYTEEHPDVVATKDSIAALEEEKRKELELSSSRPASLQGYEANPVYQQLKIALGQSEAEVSSLQVRVKEHRQRVAKLKRLVDTVPEVEAELKRLNRDYEINKRNYDALVERRESAKISQSVEQAGDDVKFKIVEPPRVPLRPSGPDRIMLSSVVLALGAGLGLALAFVLSQVRPVVYDRRSLEEVAGYPVFGAISKVWTKELLHRRRVEFGAFVSASLVLCAVYGGMLATYAAGVNGPMYLVRMVKEWL